MVDEDLHVLLARIHQLVVAELRFGPIGPEGDQDLLEVILCHRAIEGLADLVADELPQRRLIGLLDTLDVNASNDDFIVLGDSRERAKNGQNGSPSQGPHHSPRRQSHRRSPP